MPVWKGWKHLTESVALARRRESAMRRTVLALVLLAGFVAAVPVPFHSVHQAVVWLPDEAIVRADAAGHVARTQVARSAPVQGGQPVLTLINPALQAEHESAGAAVRQVQAQLRQAEVEDRIKAASLRQDLTARLARHADLQARVDALNVKASSSGRWVPAAHTELEGRYVKRGEVVGYVVDGPSRRVRAAVTQEDMDLIRGRLAHVEVRLANAFRSPVAARVLRQVPGGEFDLVSPALGTNGGGEIAVDPAQQSGTRTLKRVFDVEIELAEPSRSSVFGDRAYVRFDLGWAPLGWQWFLRLRQLFLAHLNV
jgi:putative peptide zinc metalloprotease protein